MTTSTALSPPKPRSSFWRSWKVRLTALLLLLLAGTALLYESFAVRAQNRLAAAIEAADRLDPDWRIESLLARRTIPADDQNAALAFAKAVASLPKLWPSFKYVSGKPVAAIPGDSPGKKLYRLLDEIEPPRLLPASAFEVLQEEVKAAGPCLEEAYKAARMPAGNLATLLNAERYDANFGLAYQVQSIGEVLRLDAFVRSQNKDLDGALESARTALLAARSIGDQPLFLSMLLRQSLRRTAINVIERTVAQGEPAAKNLASLQHLCEEEAMVPLYLIGIRGVRATAHAFTKAVEFKHISLNQAMSHLDYFAGPSLSKEFTSLVEFYYLPGTSRRVQAELLEFQNRQIEIARMPTEEQVKQWPALTADSAKLHWVAHRFVEPTLRLADAFMANLAHMRCLITLLAAERYRQERGRWPITMEELTPEFLTAPLLDPFTGKPLTLRRTEYGLLIYSVSSDGHDDGGTLLPNYRAAGSDVGVRLWDPDKRRQPAQVLDN